jgi:hypothetical protein
MHEKPWAKEIARNTGKLTIKMAFFIPSRNPSKGTRAVWRTLHTEYEITQDEATEFAKWFKQENEAVRRTRVILMRYRTGKHIQ